MQMNSKETASQSSQDAAADTVPQASGIDSKLLSAEAEAITEQPSREVPSHSNGSTLAEQEQKPAEPAPQADVKDTELQRRKAALLQQVRTVKPCRHVYVSVRYTTSNDQQCMPPQVRSCLACSSAHEASTDFW